MPSRSKNRPSLAESARTLVAANRQGILATIDVQNGYPYSALSDYLPLPNGQIALLISRLSEHHANIMADAKVSFLVAPARADDNMMSQARTCLLGQLERYENKAHYADEFLAMHPSAEAYLHFEDFTFFILTVQRLRYIAGFGHMGWVDGNSYTTASIDPVAYAAEPILREFNQQHEHKLLDLARAYAGFNWVEGCAMTALDRYGFDLYCRDQGKAEMTRLVFDQPSVDADNARAITLLLAEHAHQTLFGQ